VNTGLTLWVVFFVVWLLALRRATHRAFTVESIRMPGIPFQAGPVFAPTIVFHFGLSTLLCVTILTSVHEDAQMLWFGLPGAAATIVQAIALLFNRQTAGNPRQVKKVSPYWISEQWPFVLLGLSIGIAGVALWAATDTLYPLLLVGFSIFFLLTFWHYFTHYNEISISQTQFEYVRSFPRFRTFTHRRPRSQSLAMRLNRRRRGIYDVKIEEPGQAPITLTANISSRQRLQLEYESFLIRTDQA
jgi:hypothetical protein